MLKDKPLIDAEEGRLVDEREIITMNGFHLLSWHLSHFLNTLMLIFCCCWNLNTAHICNYRIIYGTIK